MLRLEAPLSYVNTDELQVITLHFGPLSCVYFRGAIIKYIHLNVSAIM